MNDIIVGVDPGETAKRAAAAAAEVARAHGTNLHLVTCVDRTSSQVAPTSPPSCMPHSLAPRR